MASKIPGAAHPAVPEGAAMASCEHAYDLVRMHGESGWKATLAQAAHRSSTACSRSASGPPAPCPLPAPSLRSPAMPPRSRAFSATALRNRMPPTNSGHGKYGQHSAERA